METEEHDAQSMRDYVRRRVAEHAAWRRANEHTIVCDEGTAALYFWPEMTEQERHDTSQFLVDMGLASRVIDLFPPKP